MAFFDAFDAWPNMNGGVCKNLLYKDLFASKKMISKTRHFSRQSCSYVHPILAVIAVIIDSTIEVNSADILNKMFDCIVFNLLNGNYTQCV